MYNQKLKFSYTLLFITKGLIWSNTSILRSVYWANRNVNMNARAEYHRNTSPHTNGPFNVPLTVILQNGFSFEKIFCWNKRTWHNNVIEYELFNSQHHYPIDNGNIEH